MVGCDGIPLNVRESVARDTRANGAVPQPGSGLAQKVEDLKEFYGNGIIIGITSETDKAESGPFVAYFSTNNFRTSWKERFEQTGTLISAKSARKIFGGKEDINHLYNLMAFVKTEYNNCFVAVSNGNQTDAIVSGQVCSSMGLKESTRQYRYKEDAHNTPRINGLVVFRTGWDGPKIEKAEMGIIKKNQTSDSVTHEDYNIEPMVRGKARLITTYSGLNQGPLPSFEGEPRTINISANGINELVDEMEGCMGAPEYRVALAVAKIDKAGRFNTRIKNYRD